MYCENRGMEVYNNDDVTSWKVTGTGMNQLDEQQGNLGPTASTAPVRDEERRRTDKILRHVERMLYKSTESKSGHNS